MKQLGTSKVNSTSANFKPSSVSLQVQYKVSNFQVQQDVLDQ